MSWPFGGRWRTYVATTVQRVFEEELVPDIPRTAPIKALFSDPRQSISRTMIDDLIKGYGFKVDRTFQWAKNGNYVLGLPNHTFLSSTAGFNETKTILQGIHGGTVDIEYHHFTELNPIHLGLQAAVDTYGYDQKTNILTGLSVTVGFDCYLENIVGNINTNAASLIIDPGEITGDEYIPPTIAELAVWGYPVNTRAMPFINPEVNELQWVLSDTVSDQVQLLYGYASDTARPGTPAEALKTAYDIAYADALALVTAAEDLATATGLVADTIAHGQLLYDLEANITVPLPDYDIEDFVYHDVLNVTIQTSETETGWFHTKYNYDLSNPDGPQLGYFLYEFGSGTYATLDAIADSSNSDAEFMPIIPFVYDQINVSDANNISATEHKNYVEIMRLLGLDYQIMGDAVWANPEASKINTAVMSFGVPIDTKDDDQLIYLFEYFRWVALNDTGTVVLGGVAAPDLSLGLNGTNNDLIISESISPNRSISIEDLSFRQQLNYSGITSALQAGNCNYTVWLNEEKTIAGTRLAEIGEVFATTETIVEGYYHYEDTIVDNQETRVRTYRERDTIVYIFRRQISSGTYREIRVSGLNLIYKIEDKDVLIDTRDELSSLLIPINKNIVDDHLFSFTKESFYARSTYVVINTWFQKKDPWYGTLFFRGVMATLAIVVVITSVGTMTAEVQTLYAGFILAGNSLVVAVLLTVLQIVGTSVLIDYAFSFLAEKVGGEVAIYLALIAAAVSLYKGGFKDLFADELMWASMGLGDAGVEQLNIETRDLFNQLEIKREEWETKLEEEEKRGEEFAPNREMLELMNLSYTPLFVAGESPEHFEERMSAPNPGMAALTYYENYVEIQTQLPTVNDTIRGFKTDG